MMGQALCVYGLTTNFNVVGYYYLYGEIAGTTFSTAKHLMPVGGVLKNLRVAMRDHTASTNVVRVCVCVNGQPTDLALRISDDDYAAKSALWNGYRHFTNDSVQVPVAAGDWVSFMTVTTGSAPELTISATFNP